MEKGRVNALLCRWTPEGQRSHVNLVEILIYSVRANLASQWVWPKPHPHHAQFLPTDTSFTEFTNCEMFVEHTIVKTMSWRRWKSDIIKANKQKNTIWKLEREVSDNFNACCKQDCNSVCKSLLFFSLKPPADKLSQQDRRSKKHCVAPPVVLAVYSILYSYWSGELQLSFGRIIQFLNLITTNCVLSGAKWNAHTHGRETWSFIIISKSSKSTEINKVLVSAQSAIDAVRKNWSPVLPITAVLWRIDLTGPGWGEPQVVKTLEVGLEKAKSHFYSDPCSCMDTTVCALCRCLGVCEGSK